ncbi:MAG: hypothetical protein VZT48_03350 [Bulleidia sp.]|nr:hypothetical protein [Bulleidia sp.]
MKKKLWIPVFCILLCAGCTRQEEESEATPQGYIDENGPYVNMKTYEFMTVKGKALDFSTITGYDDYDGLLSTKVEGYIDYSTVGDYYPSITCTDLSGNKTSIPITVHVVNEMMAGPTPVPTPVPTAEPTGCDAENAKDPSGSCNAVKDEDVQQYSVLFAGETEGLSECIAYTDDEKSCQVIYANDGSVWGYGTRN